VRYNSQRRFLLEMMVVQLAKMEATVHLKDLMHDLNRVLGEEGGKKTEVENPEQADTEKTAAGPLAPPQAELDGETQELWSQMLTRVRKKKSSLGAILQHGQLAELQNQSLTIVFPTSCNFHLIQAEKQKNRAVIEGEVSTILGKDIQVKFTMADLPESSEKPTVSATPPDRKFSVEEVVKAEPIVGTILETMDGELME
jgi:hypothetical protein